MPWPGKAASPWISTGSDRVRVVRELARLAARLVGAGAALDHRVDVLEVARVGRQRDRHAAARPRRVGAAGAVVVLHVAGAALRRGGVDGERLLALELGQDRLVGPADRVREHVQAAAVGHAEHDLAGARRPRPARSPRRASARARRGPRSRTASCRGTPCAGSSRAPRPRTGARAAAASLLGVERLAVGARLDRLAQPDALLVVGDVLDLVGDRAACRSRAARGSASAKVSPGTATRSTEAGMRRISVVGEVDGGGVERRVADRRRSRAGRAARPGGRACGAP